MFFFKRGRPWGMTLLAVWVIVLNVLPFLNLPSDPFKGVLVPVLGIIAGVLLLLGR